MHLIARNNFPFFQNHINLNSTLGIERIYHYYIKIAVQAVLVIEKWSHLHEIEDKPGKNLQQAWNVVYEIPIQTLVAICMACFSRISETSTPT